MRIVNCRQQSEEWDALRCRPTASDFDRFITPVKGDYSASANAYAAMVVAKRLGVYTEPPPSYWMTWGTEMEPNAKHAYETITGLAITEVGFILPDETDAYGGSPDGLIGDDGLIEIKCPAPETLIAYHAAGTMPIAYKPQVQGLLMISGRKWLDFWGYHPELSPFHERIMPDLAYQAKIADGLLKLLEEIQRIESCVKRMRHHLVSVPTAKSEVAFED